MSMYLFLDGGLKRREWDLVDTGVDRASIASEPPVCVGPIAYIAMVYGRIVMMQSVEYRGIPVEFPLDEDGLFWYDGVGYSDIEIQSDAAILSDDREQRPFLPFKVDSALKKSSERPKRRRNYP